MKTLRGLAAPRHPGPPFPHLALGVLLLLVYTSAATSGAVSETQAYVASGGPPLASRHAPVIAPQNTLRSYNRVGTPAARRDTDGKVEIYIDSRFPTFYFQQRQFRMGQSRYTNLIYRVHFERVPYPHLTSGKNGGLFIIVTLDEARRPVLITTVHTCGCYLAFLPTTLLPGGAFPDGWNRERQRVYGIDLPGIVPVPQPFTADQRLVVTLKHRTHRVTDVHFMGMAQLQERYRLVNASLAPVAQLKQLPLRDGTTTSFYHEEGAARGYVKNALKPFELLLMSWWALDARVGMDKEYGPAEETGTVFYTSLRPWKRKDSDMWPFADFLAFWGWRLP